MPAPRTRYGPRCTQFVRQWKILCALRRCPQTLEDLAALCGCTTRTTRRDLHVLSEAGLPVGNWMYDNADGLWGLGSIPEWPRSERAPVRELSK